MYFMAKNESVITLILPVAGQYIILLVQGLTGSALFL